MLMVKLVKSGSGIYIKQENVDSPRGNRYVGPFSSKELEILGHRAILKAKMVELKGEEAEE